jgi:CubicO group peptidase (beta-lactamase class C family)
MLVLAITISPHTSFLPPMTDNIFQKFVDDAVANGYAPGFQFTVFNKDSLIANGASGLADVPSETPFRKDHILILASCSKICMSIIALRILENGLCSNGMTLADLDDHEKLVDILPEFKLGSGSPVTKIIDGYEKELGPDGKKVPILHDCTRKVTLRMLLTHTSGLAYYVRLHGFIHHSLANPDVANMKWNHPLMAEMVYQFFSPDGLEPAIDAADLSINPQMAAPL